MKLCLHDFAGQNLYCSISLQGEVCIAPWICGANFTPQIQGAFILDLAWLGYRAMQNWPRKSWRHSLRDQKNLKILKIYIFNLLRFFLSATFIWLLYTTNMTPFWNNIIWGTVSLRHNRISPFRTSVKFEFDDKTSKSMLKGK